MPKTKRLPGYCHHKASNRGVVTLAGRDVYLPGPYGSKESRASYDKLIAEYLISGRATAGDDGPCVAEVCLAFLKHVQSYYRTPAGKPTSEQATFKGLIKLLREAYGTAPAKDFGPLQLQVLRQQMLKLDWCRKYINAQTDRVKLLFKWATAQGMVPAGVYETLRCVAGLRAGRSGARESDPVRPVPRSVLDAALKRLNKTVRAVVELQLLTGARPGEILNMKMAGLNMQGEVWKYTPEQHKTQHHGHARVILIGPRGQEVLRPFLKSATDAYLFSPRLAEEERRAELSAKRTTPLSCGNKPGSNRKRYPKRRAGDCYTVASYRRAIDRACEAAGVPSWHPHQLRHNAATLLREQFGVDAAKTVLGHRTLSTTLLYAEDSIKKAAEVMGKIG
ncbi:MAG: site-specific integrase [Phycisphaerales bacterium]|nr:site-specific integrase [Phycisphaerales bacterium]